MADILLGNVKGPQGDTGATGSQGPQGDAATITVGTVSTTAYGNTAQVINSGTAQDAVLDFVIPQGKPGEQTTRMGALTLDTITAQSADFPIPAVGETGSTVFGKIIKFFNSTISALNSKLNISDVVNNLTSTSTTQPLSAAQGKALNDALGTKAPISTALTKYDASHMVDNETIAATTTRITGQFGSMGALTLTEPGFYLLITESVINTSAAQNGRTTCHYGEAIGVSELVTTNYTQGQFLYTQNVQFVYKANSTASTHNRQYFDSASTGVIHKWRAYKIFGVPV